MQEENFSRYRRPWSRTENPRRDKGMSLILKWGSLKSAEYIPNSTQSEINVLTLCAMRYLSSVVPKGGSQEDALCFESLGSVFTFRIPQPLPADPGPDRGRGRQAHFAFGTANRREHMRLRTLRSVSSGMKYPHSRRVFMCPDPSQK
jgi:hypothetical protein